MGNPYEIEPDPKHCILLRAKLRLPVADCQDFNLNCDDEPCRFFCELGENHSIPKKHYPTCFHCRNAKIWPGSFPTLEDPGEDPEAECLIPTELMPNDEWEQFECGNADCSDCLFFEPKLIEKCSNCGEVMNVPDWTWTLFDSLEQPCCSDKCLKELEFKHIENAVGDL